MSLAQFKRKDIERRNRKDDAAFVIDNVVYDVTPFLEDHPGGIEVLLDNAGKDASRCFHDIGHSEDAKQWMKRYVIGEVVEEDKLELYRRATPVDENSSDELSLSGIVHVWGPPLVLAGLAIVAYMFLFS